MKLFHKHFQERKIELTLVYVCVKNQITDI